MSIEEVVNQIQDYLNINYNNCNIEIVNLDIGGDEGNRTFDVIEVKFSIIVKQ